MVRALPSAVPPRMYRHFALVTVLLTTGIAMFADGENREAQAAQTAVREQEGAQRAGDPAKAAEPKLARRTAQPHHRFLPDSDGFDAAFGAPMDWPTRSVRAFTTEVASDAAQAGYSDEYLATLRGEERDLLLEGLAKEGLLSPQERERRSAALIAASQARSGARSASF